MVVGLCLFIVCNSGFVLFELYGGGVLEYRGRILEMDERLPADVDYALFDHGRITPLSARQYRFLSRYEKISEACGIVGLILWTIGCLLVLGECRPEALRNAERALGPPTPRYLERFMLFKALVVFIVQNRVLLLLLIVCLSIFLLSFIMSILNGADAAFWRTVT
jgi:hypothetical protein